MAFPYVGALSGCGHNSLELRNGLTEDFRHATQEGFCGSWQLAQGDSLKLQSEANMDVANLNFGPIQS
jgi:hypothetical protein